MQSIGGLPAAITFLHVLEMGIYFLIIFSTLIDFSVGLRCLNQMKKRKSFFMDKQ